MGTVVTIKPTVEPVTLAEAKAQCRVDTSDEDSLITGLITEARETAEQITERALAPATFAHYLDAFPADGGGIRLLWPPLTSVTSIQYVDENGATQTLDSANYTVDDKLLFAWVLKAYGVDWPNTRDQANAVVVTYQAGYTRDDCPEPVKAWIKASVAASVDQRSLVAQSDRAPVEVKFINGKLDRYRVGQF